MATTTIRAYVKLSISANRRRCRTPFLFVSSQKPPFSRRFGEDSSINHKLGFSASQKQFLKIFSEYPIIQKSFENF